MGKIREQLKQAQMPEKELVKVEAIINSMTIEERKNPKIINNSRKERIARGSGTSVADINQLLKNFTQMRKMMKKLTGKAKKNKGVIPGMGANPFGNPLAGAEGGNTLPKSFFTKKKKQRKKKKQKRKARKKK